MSGEAFVVGTGLIGASIGAALRAAGWTAIGWDPSPDALEAAQKMGSLDDTAESVEDGAGADLVVLAAPVGAIVATLTDLSTDALVTDVAGVKASVVAAAAHLPHFVGGHPMAGRESSGPGAASAAMFQGASWILTTDGADTVDLDRMDAIVRSMGATPIRMAAARHDAAVAAVSHVPQVMASALVNLVATDIDALALAAGGFRDVTRIALSEPAWWTDILTANRADVAGLIRRLSADLSAWASLIAADDKQGVTAGLDSARATRRGLAPSVAAVQVLLEDRPGEIARVGNALAETGVDVRDLQLRHATRGGGGVLTLSVQPGQENALTEALQAEGFRLVP
ncbi:MAG TPA: prephenate dehydrogenase/arogenate dehydrogenase family protein [Acidimicrobiia bacterium]|nr:prephenate dehydrogenase/arogenate dehydrogenase family protein [Acidimicrobiia bacterium]